MMIINNTVRLEWYGTKRKMGFVSTLLLLPDSDMLLGGEGRKAATTAEVAVREKRRVQDLADC